MSKRSKLHSSVRAPLQTNLDINDAVREALIKRITASMQKVPIALLLTVATTLEDFLNGDAP